jgi:hypothetical protein
VTRQLTADAPLSHAKLHPADGTRQQHHLAAQIVLLCADRRGRVREEGLMQPPVSRPKSARPNITHLFSSHPRRCCWHPREQEALGVPYCGPSFSLPLRTASRSSFRGCERQATRPSCQPMEPHVRVSRLTAAGGRAYNGHPRAGGGAFLLLIHPLALFYPSWLHVPAVGEGGGWPRDGIGGRREAGWRAMSCIGARTLQPSNCSWSFFLLSLRWGFTWGGKETRPEANPPCLDMGIPGELSAFLFLARQATA